MNAATGTMLRDALTDACRTEGQAVTWAGAVLGRAENLRWPDGAREPITKAARDLRDALDMHHALRSDRLHWEHYDPDLDRYCEPYEVALAKSAEDAQDTAAYLAEIIGRHMGSDVAAYVSGEKGD